jgi:hypothetical protein
MERVAIKELFGKNFLGKEELKPFLEKLGFDSSLISEPKVQYDDDVLYKAAADNYILIWGIDHLEGKNINLLFLREVFGIDPEVSEPCFYNQDWYLKEDFMNITLQNKWYLVKKDVFEDSRAVMPNDLENKGLNFPPAVLCVYTFFAYYLAYKEYLWYHDFVWCNDRDHNGDRVYVGKYHDIDGVNKNGFSIHRHLALRDCYASSNYIG